MGCSNSYYDSNLKGDYFNKSFYESSKTQQAKKREKEKKKEMEKQEAIKKKEEEAIKMEKDQEAAINKGKDGGPSTFLDKIVEELPPEEKQEKNEDSNPYGIQYMKSALVERVYEDSEESDESDEESDNEKKQKKPNQENKLQFLSDPDELTLAFIGYQGGGKTSLVGAYRGKPFERKYTKTTEIYEYSDCVYRRKNKDIRLKLFDTIGIPHHGSYELVQEKIRESHIIIYVFDISEDDPLFKIKLNFSYLEIIPNQIICLIGTNDDKNTENKENNKNKIKEFCAKNHYTYSFVSNLIGNPSVIKEVVQESVMKSYFNAHSKNTNNAK